MPDTTKLPALFDAYLDEYNTENKEMKLVFFWDAIEHISRICRVLRQPRGNAMLVGVGGSGKQSLTRFASYISEMKCFQIELSKGYGYTEFREDLKKLYMMAGCDGTPWVNNEGRRRREDKADTSNYRISRGRTQGERKRAVRSSPDSRPEGTFQLYLT